jgi:F0F1-type ATP synthase assembly protein I
MGFILIMLWLKGWQSALSAFAGSMSYALPTFLFLWLLSRFAGAKALSRFMMAFFLGEALKLISCGVLFLIIIQLFHLNLLNAFLGLSVSIVAFWIASPAALFRRTATHESR